MPLLIEADGVCPTFGVLASSTGRTGHLTELQLDGFTQRLGVECKNRESIGDWLFSLAADTSTRADGYGKLGLSVLKKNRRPPLALMTLDHYLNLLRSR